MKINGRIGFARYLLITNKFMKYIKRNSFVPAVAGALVLSAAGVDAGEHTAKIGKFEQIIKLQAVALPSGGVPISIEPEVWKTSKIEKFVAHGASVKKGDTLFWIDTKALDEKIEDLTKERVKQKLALKKAELEFLSFKATTEESIAKAKLDYRRFQEDYDYYKVVTRPQAVSDIKYKVKRSKDYLAYSQEELDQLLKMYEEDGLTEETEEIIIQRSKNSLVASKRSVANAERTAKFKLKVAGPRADQDWLQKAVTKKREYELALKTLPLDLELKELGFAKLKEADAKSEEKLNDLKADRKLLEFRSPVDGVVYFGEFKDGRWVSEVAKKAIRKGGALPVKTTLMTIVPADSELKFNAFLNEGQKALFKAGQVGNLRLQTNAWESIPMGGELISSHPNFSHQWLVAFTPKAAGSAVDSAMVGSKANVTIVAGSFDNVLSIPVSAVKSNPDGTYTVKVKMAEGEPKVTVVELGRHSGDKVEVLKGLENGQVILTP